MEPGQSGPCLTPAQLPVEMGPKLEHGHAQTQRLPWGEHSAQDQQRKLRHATLVLAQVTT